MKTITTFIIALTTLILSGVVFLYTINIAKYIPTTFYNIDKSESYTFSFTFVLASVLSFILTMSLISVSIKYFTLYLKYYSNYMHGKRDREIKDKVENAKYNQLYEDLRDCETVELKEAVLNTFYSTKDVVKSSNNNRARGIIMSKAIKAVLDEEFNKQYVGDWPDMDDTTPAKPIRKIPTPHDLMGFEDIIFDRVNKE